MLPERLDLGPGRVVLMFTGARSEATMKLILGFAVLATLGLIASNASAEERPCRPSLSNFYHCPDTTSPTTNSTKATEPAVTPKPTRAPTSRSANRAPVPSGASEGSKGLYQYTTEGRARLRCPADTVVWANTRSNIYHFQGTRDYGNTKRGGYMCEQDAVNEGMRAAKNETHP
jgi:hypothetical protein